MFNLRALRIASIIAMSSIAGAGAVPRPAETHPTPPKIRSSSRYLLVSNGARERARRLRQLRSGTLHTN